MVVPDPMAMQANLDVYVAVLKTPNAQAQGLCTRVHWQWSSLKRSSQIKASDATDNQARYRNFSVVLATVGLAQARPNYGLHNYS